MTAFNAMLFLIRNVLENIAQAATALTNRQLPYLINYDLWNVLFSKPSDNQRQSVGPPELRTPNTSSPSFSSTQKKKTLMKPNLSEQRGQCTRSTQQPRYMEK